jgi:glutamate-1-semialdehyde 2,1-aminomutase
VEPDLTALGKIIGGGFPIGALAGKSEIMKVLDPRETFLRHPHSGTFSANPISITAGYTAMRMFDKQAVLNLNNLTKIAIKQVEEVISLAGIPACVTGDGSMFRVHFNNTKPTTYRESYQEKEVKIIINKLLDYLFLKEDIIMINTCACMFSTTLNQQHVDKLSESLLNGFRIIKPELENLF